MCAAPKKNEYWRLRTKHGRDRIFENPEDLAEACNQYFDWCDKNPLKESQVFQYQGTIVKTEVPKMRALTIEGLCNFIDIAVSTFQEYEKKEGFSVITTRARQIIYNQKFEGAASGFLNANLIARDLGLRDHQDHTTNNESLNDLSRFTTEELLKRAEATRKIKDSES